ncbi:MAG: helix-turn-helix domain-containing protein [Actinopolymorphaceae bacterium]
MSSEKGRSDSTRGASGTDPRVLRAVAHPVRLDLLYLLRREGPLTASRCAEFLDLTPKVCSYHLNLLGKYGLIEETGEGKGRARPWRLRTAGLSYVHQPGESREAASAADEFARTMLARDAQQVEAFIEGRRTLPRSWRNVATMSSNPLRLTSEQLRALGSELIAVLDRYSQLSESTSAGAHPVHLAMYAVPVDIADLAP